MQGRKPSESSTDDDQNCYHHKGNASFVLKEWEAVGDPGPKSRATGRGRRRRRALFGSGARHDGLVICRFGHAEAVWLLTLAIPQEWPSTSSAGLPGGLIFRLRTCSAAAAFVDVRIGMQVNKTRGNLEATQHVNNAVKMEKLGR